MKSRASALNLVTVCPCRENSIYSMKNYYSKTNRRKIVTRERLSFCQVTPQGNPHVRRDGGQKHRVFPFERNRLLTDRLTAYFMACRKAASTRRATYFVSIRSSIH